MMKSMQWKMISLQIVMILSVAFCTAHPTSAQTELVRSVIGSGGGISVGSGIVLQGTIGQPVIGVVSGGGILGLQGFWYMPAGQRPSSVEVALGIDNKLTADLSPNPCTQSTVLRFASESRGQIEIGLYDLLGRELALLFKGEWEGGIRAIPIDVSGLAAGRYIIRIRTPHGQQQLPLVKSV